MGPAEAEARLRRALAAGRDGPSGGATSDGDLPGAVPPPEPLRPAAVLVAVDLSGPEARVLLTKRAAHLRHHPGQVAFPGGRLDPGDDGPVAAALREAAEEVALPRGSAEVLGTFGPHATITGFSVTAVVALLRGPFQPVPERGEVEEAFFVPLAALMDLGRYRVERRRWRGAWRPYWVVPHGPHYVWGATARMLRALAERMEGA